MSSIFWHQTTCVGSFLHSWLFKFGNDLLQQAAVGMLCCRERLKAGEKKES
jgi:hypothetical protein